MPVANTLWCIGRQRIDREHTGEACRVCFHRGQHIGIVVAVAGRGLHQGRFTDACFIHGSDHLFERHRSIL